MQIESTKSNQIATINLNAAINSTNICMVHKNIANMCKLNATSTAKFKIVLIITNELSVPCSVTFWFLANESQNICLQAKALAEFSQSNRKKNSKKKYTASKPPQYKWTK